MVRRGQLNPNAIHYCCDCKYRKAIGYTKVKAKHHWFCVVCLRRWEGDIRFDNWHENETKRNKKIRQSVVRGYQVA